MADRFSIPPGLADDAAAARGLPDAWSRLIADLTERTIGYVMKMHGVARDALPFAPSLAPDGARRRRVLWTAFPRRHAAQYGIATTVEMADGMRAWHPIGETRGGLPVAMPYRNHTEYCEWRVVRDGPGNLGPIRKVIFSTELREYWLAFAAASRAAVLARYRALLETDDVALEEITFGQPVYRPPAPRGLLEYAARGYNPWNAWNTSRGIVHMASPGNGLSPLLLQTATATLRRADGPLELRDPVRLLGALDDDTGGAGINDSADVAIAGVVGALARAGKRVAVADPFAVRMVDLDTRGWKVPDGKPAERFWRVVRPAGPDGGALRAEFAVPRGAGFSVSDLEIFGVPIRHGSQIAQCLTVGFDVLAEDAGRVAPVLPGRARAMRPTDGSNSLITVPLAHPDDPRYQPMFPDTPPDRPEPILDDRDIQGNALAGFNKNHQWIIGFDIVDPGRARLWLEAKSHVLSTTLEVAEHNQRYRAFRAGRGDRPAPAVWLNLAFSFAGLRLLRDDAAELPSRAFRQGIAGRGWLRVDGREPHILAILAADQAPMLRSVLGTASEIAQRARDSGLRVVFHEIGDNEDLEGADHFGFKDGISQPGIRGRLSHPRHDPLTPREVVLGKSHASYRDPHGPEYARPGQMLVWPGEFVLGYPRQSPHHPREPAPGHPVTPAWSRNGSFLVYLRLKQDVAAFERAVAAEAAARGVSPDEAAAMMVGRHRDGRPLVAGKSNHDNHFLYADAAEPMATTNRRVAPRVPGDPLGARCPFTAHIRKVNPRDDTTEEGAIPAILRRRILRRGIPYRRDDERGLLFVSYQASIEEQFEQVVGGWAMGAERPAGPGGVDAILGRLGEPGHFIELVAGGYFFSPAISSVRLLAR